jgi:hypothetical protein
MVTIVIYQGDALAIPSEFGGGTVFTYATAALKLNQNVRKILWNDKVRRMTVKPCIGVELDQIDLS